MRQDDCIHTDPNEPILQGVCVSEEVKRTVEMGYIIKAVYEIWQYEVT